MNFSVGKNFNGAPDPENPGWFLWDAGDPDLFPNAGLGPIRVRPESERSCRFRFHPERRHGNLFGNIVHGGVTTGLADSAMFIAINLLLDIPLPGPVTLDLSCQFMGAARVGEPMDFVVEILKETGRFVFLRGLAEQADETILSYTGTTRKAARK
ncbi:MAG: PaaI family thioesterase [Novosphingobium sp.]